MSTTKFGWSYPPGVSTLPWDVATFCEVCCKDPEGSADNNTLCVCEECPVCEAFGDPGCYKSHGMKLTKAILVARQEFLVARAKEKVREEEIALKDLIAKDDPFAKESDGGEPYNLWSDKLEEQEDPFAIKLRWS